MELVWAGLKPAPTGLYDNFIVGAGFKPALLEDRMAARKISKKAVKATGKKKAAPSQKISLPAFGLAEEILGEASVELETRSDVADFCPPTPVPRTPVPVPVADSELHLVTFNLDREEYGVDIGSVYEIIRVGQITTVPNAPDYIKGVINLRGKVIPVLNLRKRLELPDEKLTKNSRIMVVESGKKTLGILVDSVSQVLRIPVSSVDDPPGEVEQMKAYVRGIGKVDERLIMIMDLSKALAKDAATGEEIAQ